MKSVKGRIFPCVISLIFCVVGVAVLCLAITAFADEARYIKTTATVISAEVGYSDEGKLTAVSTYEYYAGGERYVRKTATTDANSAKLEGETFTVKYDPDNPEEVHSSGHTAVVMFVFGVVFTSVGGGLFIALVTGKLN